MTLLKTLAVAAYLLIALGTWITFARDWSFQDDSQGNSYGSKEHSPEWGLCIFFAFFLGLAWPLATLWNVPWHRWPIKLENEREALALDRQKRCEEGERELGLDE